MLGPARPVLGIVAEPNDTRALRNLVRALAQHVAVRALRPGGDAPDALLATSPAALAGAPGWDGPTALWIGNAAHLEQFRDLPASVPHTVITPLQGAAQSARASGAQVLLVHQALGEVPSLAWEPPLVRARRRRGASLPDCLVVVVDEHDAATDPATPPEAAPATGQIVVRHVQHDDPALADLLRCASAAVVPARALGLALASGCPTVAEQASADTLGATHGQHLLVASTADSVTEARRLVADPGLATRLSWAATQQAARASVDRAATDLLGLLGLAPPADTPWERTLARLAEVDLPETGPFRRRVLDALSPFQPEGAPLP